MLISRRGLFPFAAAALPRTARAQSAFARARAKEISAPDGTPIQLRGINLGNWLVPEGYMFLLDNGPQSKREIEDLFSELVGPAEAELFWTAWRKAYVTPADIRFIKRCGFNSVRIPFHWSFFQPQANGFALLRPIIEACRTEGLWAILDMHCAPGGQTGTNIDDSYGYPMLFESEKNQAQFVHTWVRIARHYRDEPAIFGYDLLNEPIPHFPELKKYNSALEPLYERVTRAIREVDRNHMLILGGAQWDSNFDVFSAPFDDNLVYTFHKYWVPPTIDSIRPYLEFRDRYNVPIWMGESGENTDEWITTFRGTLEQNNVGWHFWPYKKMVKTSCVASVKKPESWDDITKFATMTSGTGNAEKRIAARPSVEVCRAALKELLANVRLDACSVNQGYLKALGLTAV